MTTEQPSKSTNQEQDEPIITTEEQNLPNSASTTRTDEGQDEAAALASADALNSSLLQSDHERSYITLKDQYDILSDTCSKQQSEISSHQGLILELQRNLRERNGEVATVSEKSDVETRKRETAEEAAKNSRERATLMEVEADSLFQQISRLTSTNNSLNAQLTELKTSSTFASSSTVPLQYEITRLKAELESQNAHSKWLETEVETRSKQNSDLKIQRSDIEQNLTRKIDNLTTTYNDTSLEVSSLETQLETALKKMDAVQSELKEKVSSHADVLHELELEIQTERRLVSLNKENAARAEDRYNDAIREVQSMKRLACVALKDHDEEMEKVKNEAQMKCERLIEKSEKENERKVNEVEEKLRVTLMEKTKLEDDFMSSSFRRSGDKGADAHSDNILAITNNATNNNDATDRGNMLLKYTSASGEPMAITDVYEKLADAEEEARKQKAECRRTELFLERFQREIEMSVPKRRQERREYENAKNQVAALQERLEAALERENAATDALNEKQMEGGEKIRECGELRLENQDLARQVQTLLRNSMGRQEQEGEGDIATFGSAEELQNQNQRLLREYHRLTSKISELEEKINTDASQIKLIEAEKSMKEMLEERESQATLVANIVQQRDLYRALLAKNDSQVLASAGVGANTGAIVAAKDQIEKYTDAETKNRELMETNASLKADLSTVMNTKDGLEERLTRLDAHVTDLSDSIKTYQSELTAAHASIARYKAESSYKTQVVERLEISLEAAKKRAESVDSSKREMQRVNEDLQSVLSTNRLDLARWEENLRQSEVKLRLAETKLQSLQAAESRLSTENNSLRSEMARHSALHESMQKIEVSISARADEERERMSNEITRLTDLLSSERAKHTRDIQGMQDKATDYEIRANALEKKTDEAVSENLVSKNDALDTKVELQSLKEKCKSLEETLNATKIRLNDEDTDTSDRDKFVSMVTDLEALRNDLAAQNKKTEDYRNIAKANEEALADSTKANEEFKVKMTAVVDKLESRLSSAQRTARVKQEALEELTKDLNNQEGKQEKVISELKASNEILEREVQTAKNDNESMKAQVKSLTNEINTYKTDAGAATDNYERELALHASARTDLRNIRSKAESESLQRQTLLSQLEELKAEISGENVTWNETKGRLEEAEKDAMDKVEELRQQNKILHSQLAALSETVEKYQSDRIASLSEITDTSKDEAEGKTSSEILSLQKQLSEMRETVRFMHSERETFDSQLLSARRSIERERAAAEIMKHSLEEARVEVALLQKSESDQGEGGDSSSNELHVKLKKTEEHLVLLRESNQLLREETEKLGKIASTSQKDLEQAKNAYEPTEQKCHQLEVGKAALEAEKLSLGREVKAWKDRVSSLVSKFHKIDPEEHSIALSKLEENKKQIVSLKASKDQAEKETSNAKAVVSRLNKDITKQREVIESKKTALEKMTSEKIALLKCKVDAASLRKELDNVNKSKMSVGTELEGYKKRVDNLTRILKKNNTKFSEHKQKLQEITQKEQETKSMLLKEKELHQALLKNVEVSAERERRLAQSKENLNVLATAATEMVVPIQTLPSKDKNQLSTIATASPLSTAHDNASIDVRTESALKRKKVGNDQQIPQVPTEGFKFAPSHADAKSVSDKQESADSVSMSKVNEKNAGSAMEVEEKDSSLSLPSSTQNVGTTGEIPPVIESSKKLKQGEKSRNAQSEKRKLTLKSHPSKEDIVSNKKFKEVEKSGNTQPETMKLTPKKLLTKEDALASKKIKHDEKIVNAQPEKTKPILKTLPSKEDALSSKKSKDVETIVKAQPETIKPLSKNPPSKEDALREKILKKKRQLAEMKGKGALSSTAVSKRERADSTVTTVVPVLPAQDETMSSESIIAVSMSKSDNPASAGLAPVQAIKVKEGEKSNAPLSSLCGSEPMIQIDKGSTPSKVVGTKGTVSGSATSKLSGKATALQSNSKEKSLSSTPKEGNGVFLNLQPPGSGQSNPIFGGSSKIILPTPSKSPLAGVVQQPFGVFGAAIPKQVNVASIDGVTNKKRPPEDDAHEERSQKLARVVEEDETHTKNEEDDAKDSKAKKKNP